VGIGDADIWLLENVVWRAPYFHANSTTSMTAPPHSMDLMRQMARMLLIWSRSFLPVMPHHRPMMARQIYK